MPEKKIKIYKTIAESIVTYGAEVWWTREPIRKRVHMEIGYWSVCCRLILLDTVNNEEITESMNTYIPI